MSTGLLASRRAVITGGANGIGAVAAGRLAELGAAGVVLDLPAALTGATAPGWHELAVDVLDEESVRAAIGRSAELLGGIDAVIAAAGVVPSWQPIDQLDLADFDRVLAVNARGVVSTVKHAAPLLAAGSSIVVVASLNSWRGDPNIVSYAASKHAVLGIVRSAALALGLNGVRVNAVAPGPIATDALRSRMASRVGQTGLDVDEALVSAARSTSLGRIATAAEVADTIAFLTSDMASGITGQLVNVDGGIF
jgi:NAD(P)-dependent dehydrogenase (short-subunit alcohol dehydrogenase family)